MGIVRFDHELALQLLKLYLKGHDKHLQQAILKLGYLCQLQVEKYIKKIIKLFRTKDLPRSIDNQHVGHLSRLQRSMSV